MSDAAIDPRPFDLGRRPLAEAIGSAFLLIAVIAFGLVRYLFVDRPSS